MRYRIPHNEITKYFHSDQWQRLLKYLRGDHTEEIYHAHIFIDTGLHPNTLRRLLIKYFEVIGMPIDRPIDFQASNVGHDMLHNIHPSGTFHFDLAFHFNPHLILAPMPLEITFQNANLQVWGKSETYAFFQQFPFKTEVIEDKIDQYFYSPQWDEIRTFVKDKSLVHFHANVETSVHPDRIKEAALRALKREGWVLQKAAHCIFFPRKDWKAGKICLLMSEPMFNFDIAWVFNPDVVIIPSRRFFIQQIRPDFDLRHEEPIEKLLKKGNFTPDISNQELDEIGKRISEAL